MTLCWCWCVRDPERTQKMMRTGKGSANGLCTQGKEVLQHRCPAFQHFSFKELLKKKHLCRDVCGTEKAQLCFIPVIKCGQILHPLLLTFLSG